MVGLPLVVLVNTETQTPKFPMTIESIMRGPALVGHAPSGLRWSADGSVLRFSWAKADGKGEPAPKEFMVNKDGTGLAPSIPEAPRPESAVPRGSRVGNQVVYEQLGDLYLYDVPSKATKRLTETPETESNARLITSGKAVVYQADGALYRLDLADGAKTKLAEIKNEAKPSPTKSPGLEAKPAVISVVAGTRSGSFSISPAGTHASVPLLTPATPSRVAEVPAYVTSSGYPEMIPTYERVGAPQSHSKDVVVNLETGATIEIAPARAGNISNLSWSPDGNHAIAMARAEDSKDVWIIGFDTKTEKTSVLWTEHNDAWVGGPGRGLTGWLPDGSRFYFSSERNGYANLLSMPAGGGEIVPIVEGKFEVSGVRMDTEHNRFTFVSSEGSPFKRHLDVVKFDGKGRRKLADLSADEDMQYAIAPDGETVAVVKSKPNRPGELYVNNVQVTTTPTEEWLSGPWIEPEVVMVPSTDGVKVPARLYKSKTWKKGGPAVIFIHGAGYLQNVYDGWSHYFREYMFHHYLMDKGYVVLDMDYRGSAGYGRDWRTAIYRHTGGKDLDDEVAGAEWLVSQQGVAKDRLGVYGGSYGGFLTLMAMFTRPGVFASGAALRPVT
ncbi:MAG: prolyl oligopeptidase family serine peptidase, partial [Armatimonadota bacterium]